MADPTPESMQEFADSAKQATDASNALIDSQDRLKNQFSIIENVIGSATSSVNALIDAYADAGKGLQEGLFKDKDINNIGLLTTALLGAKDAASQFSGITLDFSGFKTPLNEMQESLSKGGGALKDMSEAVLSSFGSIIPNSIKGSAQEVVQFGINLLTSSDNAIHTRDAMIQLAAQTGNLNNLYAAAGPNLENINELVAEQTDRISNVAGKMGIAREDAVKYYIELGKIPGFMSEFTEATSGSLADLNDVSNGVAKGMTMFTATLAAAKGMGKDVSSVTKDMVKAFQDYGIKGQAALNFSEMITDVTNNLGIELSSVQAALHGSADEFKRFADAGAASAEMSANLAKLTNEYAQELKNQGLSGDQALNTAKDMIDVLSNLSIAQRAYLSAQSGGAGGLLGAVQIEKELREGKIDNVFKRVKEVMQKQLGPIITQGEVKTESQAAQYTRQITMLQQGPLGKFAKDEESAARILEAFKSGNANIKQLDTNSLKNSIDKGTTLQDQTKTALTNINAIAQRHLAETQVTNMILLQGFTAAKGSGGRGGQKLGEEGETPLQESYRDLLRQQAAMFGVRETQVTRRTQTALESGTIDRDANTASEAITETTSAILKPFMSADFLNKTKNLVEKKWEEIKEGISSSSGKDKEKKIKEANEFFERNKNVLGDLNDPNSSLKTLPPGDRLLQPINNSLNNFSSQSRRSEPGTANLAAAVPITHAHPAAGTLGDINVHVTGYCIRCKQEIEGGDQVSALSPSARRTSP